MAAATVQVLTEAVLSVGEHLILQTGQDMKETGQIRHETLNQLHFIYGHQLYQALELLDQNGASDEATISCLHVSSSVKTQPTLYQVNASRHTTQYLCLPSSNYCSCPSFRYDVLVRDEVITCKHLLAVKLAVAMETLPIKRKTITNTEYTTLIDNLISSFN